MNIPNEYSPYEKVTFCSNVLLKVKFLIEEKGFYPLLIGKGKSHIPNVWLFARNKDYQPLGLVNKSISLLPIVSVNIDDENKTLIVLLNEKQKQEKILEIDYTTTENIKINAINLEPLGYNIWGNTKTLRVAGATIARNTLNNVENFIGLR